MEKNDIRGLVVATDSFDVIEELAKAAVDAGLVPENQITESRFESHGGFSGTGHNHLTGQRGFLIYGVGLNTVFDLWNSYNSTDLKIVSKRFMLDRLAELKRINNIVFVRRVTQEYDAEISENGSIKVGCQTVTVEKARELYKALHKIFACKTTKK
jgi:hypothetical protein